LTAQGYGDVAAGQGSVEGKVAGGQHHIDGHAGSGGDEVTSGLTVRLVLP